MFDCNQAFSTIWTVGNLPSGAMPLIVNLSSSQVGAVLNFTDDPGFGFEIHVLDSGSAVYQSELRVTAVRELNGVTVECAGFQGNFMSTIQIASVGEYILQHVLGVHMVQYCASC